MAAVSAGSAQSTQDLSFLQERVATVLLYMGSGGLTFWLMRLGFESPRGDLPKFFGEPSALWHLAAVTIMLGSWLACRRGSRSRRFVRACEVFGLLGGCFAYSGMVPYMDFLMRPEHLLMMICTVTLFARSIWIPSTARRTWAFGAVLSVPLLVMAYTTSRLGYDPAIFHPDSSYSQLDTRAMALNMLVNAGLWWLLVTSLCALASSVIHGLRKEVRNSRKLGQYVLEEKIGEGAMGVVYRASHAMLRRPTAIKLLPPEKAGVEALELFEREVQLTAMLSHPNTVTVFDYGRTPDDVCYYAMELLDGANLETIVAMEGPQPVSRVIRILQGVAGSLAEAHEIGLIHRDIKPANIIMCRHGGVADVAKVVDFGLVRQLDTGEPGDEAVKESMNRHIAGTPAYMAPESFETPGEVDAGVDIYALGAVGYHLLTGDPPFSGRTVLQLFMQHREEPPVPPSERLGQPIPAGLEQLVLDCLAKKREDRPATARAVLERLEPMAQHARSWDGEAWWKDRGEQVRQALEAERARQGGQEVAKTVMVDVSMRFEVPATVRVTPSGEVGQAPGDRGPTGTLRGQGVGESPE